jgi:hypothetical protein
MKRSRMRMRTVSYYLNRSWNYKMRMRMSRRKRS